MGKHTPLITGTGIGLRRPHMGAMQELLASGDDHSTGFVPDFLEVAPENWLGLGGAMGRQFSAFCERFPMVLHGLSLNLGGPTPLDETFLQRLKAFIRKHKVPLYSEHLSYCSDGGHLYDLMPIPFTAEAVMHVAARIRRVQDILEQRIAIENISYYAAPGQEMSELEFFKAVVNEADCDILLDVNNVYVNSINHGYNATEFLCAMPAERIAYLHIAGHYEEDKDFLIDTHGAAINDPVWQLLEKSYSHYGVYPTLLERDFNLPPLDELLAEASRIRNYQHKWSDSHADGTTALHAATV